jgi:hypothetical protein
MIAAVADFVPRHVDRNPEIRTAGKGVPRGHDADDGVRLSIQVKGFPQDLALTGEVALPESVAEDCNVGTAILVFTLGEGAAKLRLGAEEAEKVGLGANHFGAFGTVLAADVKTVRPGIEAHVFEGGVLGAPVEIVLAVQGIGTGSGFRFPESDDLFWVAERKRLQKNSMNDGEDGSDCADAQSQGQDRHNGEPGILAHGAEGVKQVLRQVFDPAGFAHGWQLPSLRFLRSIALACRTSRCP